MALYTINKMKKKIRFRAEYIAGFLPADLMNEMSALLVKQSKKKGRKFLNPRYGMDHQTENRFLLHAYFF